MPIQPTYPGVYIQEVPSGVRTITGVSTSIAAFFGRTQKGPINKAVRCLSFSDFLRSFGGPHSLSDLGSSVHQFFANGGTDCYVVRLAEGAAKASIRLRNLANTANVMTVTAKTDGAWGNNLRLTIDYNTPSPDETFNLTITHEEDGNTIESEQFANLSMNPDSPRFAIDFVTASSNMVDLSLDGFNLQSAARVGFSESRRPIAMDTVANLCTALNNLIYTPPNGPSDMEISVDNGPFMPVSLKKNIATLNPATFADVPAVLTALEGEINGQLVPGFPVKVELPAINGGGTLGVLRLVSDTAATQRLSVKVRSAQSKDLAGPLMFGVDQGGIESSRYANHRPAPTGTFLTAIATSASGASTELDEFAVMQQDAFSTLTISGVTPPDNSINLAPAGTSKLITTLAGHSMFRDNLGTALNGNNDGVREKLRILAKAINEAPNLPVRAEVWGYHLAVLPITGIANTTHDLTSAGPVGAVNIGTGGSALFKVNVRQYSLGNTGTGAFQTGGIVGRDDDGNPATPDIIVSNYTGSEIDKTGFYALDKVDLFNLMILPGDRDITESQYEQISVAASTYCEKRRAFLLLDAPNDWSKSGNLNQDELKYSEIRNGMIKNQAAIFYPRVKFSDAGTMKYIGASGMIAGLMARTDSQRGVWKAPAGIEAGLRGAFDLEVNLTDIENGILNKQGVNCIRKFPNGIVNWGSRTLDGADDFGSEWKYIPIRRLALFLEESLFRGTKWVVFEPNDEPLWAKIRMNLNAFMMSLFKQGAFQGSTPDKAFFVKCDGETTTANDRNLGIVNIQVGFAPLKPAEFVIISIQQIPDV